LQICVRWRIEPPQLILNTKLNDMTEHNLKHETATDANVLLGISKKPLPIALIGAIYVAKGCDPDDVADVTYNALKNGLNLADELYNAFYCA